MNMPKILARELFEVFARDCPRSLHNPGSSWLSSRNSVWTIEKIWRRYSIVCSLHAGIIYRCCAYTLDNFSRKYKFRGRNFQGSRAAISGGSANNKTFRWYLNKVVTAETYSLCPSGKIKSFIIFCFSRKTHFTRARLKLISLLKETNYRAVKSREKKKMRCSNGVNSYFNSEHYKQRVTFGNGEFMLLLEFR